LIANSEDYFFFFLADFRFAGALAALRDFLVDDVMRLADRFLVTFFAAGFRVVCLGRLAGDASVAGSFWLADSRSIPKTSDKSLVTSFLDLPEVVAAETAAAVSTASNSSWSTPAG